MKNVRMLAFGLMLLIISPSFCGEEVKPLFRDFMGINGHTVTFKPELYRPVCRLVRDYHPVAWDLGDDTGFVTTFPMARNRVDWLRVYGSWQKQGWVTNACLMIDSVKPEAWKDSESDARQYGKAFAKAFGPSSAMPLVSSVEIGNEPGSYEDKQYRVIFENMARGVREGDAKMTIATCALTVGKSHKYAKSVDCVAGLNELYDVVNIHVYAEAQPWPTWRRSYPEDPGIKYLKEVEDAVSWRDKNAPGKALWITEFGWDASSKQAPKTGDFAKWEGSTELQQAQWLVRSFLVFSKMPVARAYIFFFDDKDEPQVHGASGLTRNLKPKPSFYAVAHLFKTLGEYRFKRVLLEKENDTYAYEFAPEGNGTQQVWAVWSGTKSARTAIAKIPHGGLKVLKAEQMALSDAPPTKLDLKTNDETVEVPVSETPTFIWLDAAK